MSVEITMNIHKKKLWKSKGAMLGSKRPKGKKE